MKPYKQALTWALTHYGWLFIFGGLVAFWQFYHDLPQDSDTGCFSAVATSMRYGEVLYRDVWDNKAPGIFFLHQFFQWISGCSMYYFTWLQLTFLAGFFTSLYLVLKKQFPNSANIGIAIAVVFWLYWATQWRYFYVGGFTEEIGFYSLVTGFMLWVLNSNLRGLTVTSGFLLALACLIKEPFVFMVIPVLTFVLLQRPGFKKLKLGILGFLIPLVCWALYLTIFRAWPHYMNYLKFALMYGKSSGASMEVSLELDHFYSNLWQDFPEIKRILFVGIFITAFFIRNWNQRILLASLVLLLVSSTLFLFLGKQLYGHYWIPMFGALTLLVVFASCLFLQKGFELLNHWIRYKNTQILLTVLLTFGVFYQLEKYRLHIINEHWNDKNYVKGVAQECSKMGKWKTHQSVFVADQSLGRLYFYLNKKSNLKFPCPYYVYFKSGSENQENKFAIKNRVQFDSLWKLNTPEIILESDVHHFRTFLSEVQRQPFKLSDSLKFSGFTVRRWERRGD